MRSFARTHALSKSPSLSRGIVEGFVLSLIFIIICGRPLTASDGWKQISNGLSYKKLEIGQKFSGGEVYPQNIVHLLQIDPKNYKLNIVTAVEFGQQNIDARSMAEKTGAMVAINGGFFTPDFKHLGLIVQNGKQLSKLKWTSWWHVFKITKALPQIVSKQEFQLTKETEMAIEAGPRLLTDGMIPSGLKPSSARRTGIGITNDGKIIIAVTENFLPDLNEFAKVLLQAGCYNALNLDGGSSTQIYAKVKGFRLDLPGFGSVANGIAVFPR